MTSLQLIKVDFQRVTNATAHRTIDYDTTELVARRGGSISLVLNFNRPIQSGDGLTFTVETGPRPSESNNTRAVMPVSTSGSRTSWSAVRGNSSGNSLTVTINTPVTSVIGRYRTILKLTSGGRTSSNNLETFVLLFNPWASDDETYMANEAERAEYVLNDVGLYWYGSANGFYSAGWDYGQFEKDIMDICLDLLDRSSIYLSDPALRSDPVQVGRAMGAMVNSNDGDRGVVLGNWSGNYSGGVNPSQWVGSVAILRQWKRSGPVKYGQCWVYAGVLCTVLRCLGMPARLIVNFESAHDTNANLIIENYYDVDGNKDNTRTEDSVWNFHAWNEMWCTRKDLGSFYDGWQIVDATPQETSGGVYRLGPCSQKAVKEGDVDLKFDTPFVFAEVNADTNNIMINRDGSERLLYSNTQAVGRYTSTKAVGSYTRQDVTDQYKYKEGSAKEREIMTKAKNKMRPAAAFANIRVAHRDVQPEEAVKPEFSGTFKNADTQVGDDLIMQLVLKGTSDKTRTVKVNSTATAIIYNSTPVKQISAESQSVTLKATEENMITFKITYPQYAKAITADNMISMVAVCEDEMGGRLLVTKVVTMKNPPLLIRINEQARLDKKSTVDIIFSNPMKDNVDDSVVIIEGSGLLKEAIVVNVDRLQKNQRATIECEIHPYRVGEKGILVAFSSPRFPSSVKGFQPVTVAPS